MDGLEIHISGYVYNSYNKGTVTGGSYIGGLVGRTHSSSCRSYIYNSYTINGNICTGNAITQNCYTTDINSNIENLNSGIDDVTTNTNTEQPWRADTKHINDGYPILYWQ